MPEDSYSVRINRREGILEISGPDKVWIAEQLERLSVVYTQAVEAEPQESDEPSTGDAAGGDESSDAGSSTQKTRTPRRTGGRSTRSSRNAALEKLLTREIKNALGAYVDARKKTWNKQPAQAAILATFLQDELQWSRVDGNDLYTVYSVMGWPAPNNPRSAIDNARVRNNYFGGWTDHKIELTHAGENFGRHGSLDSPPSS